MKKLGETESEREKDSVNNERREKVRKGNIGRDTEI